MKEKEHWELIATAINALVDVNDIETLFAEAFQDAFEQGYNQACEEMQEDKK